MYSVKWVRRENEPQPILIESNFLQALDKVMSSCRRRLPAMRLDHPESSPDGFIVLSSDGEEVRRLFGSAQDWE
jgi:hypothetical protein